MRIALVPMAAKPYHAGHHYLVTKASRDNDIVKLFVSISDRKRKGELPILGEDMLTSWKEAIEPILPDNVEVEYGGSPVLKVYQAIGNAAENNDFSKTFVIYSDVEDTSKNYPMKNRIKYMEPLYSEGNVLFAAEADPKALERGSGAPEISGTEMRRRLGAQEEESFKEYLPTELPDEAKTKIYQRLAPKPSGLIESCLYGNSSVTQTIEKVFVKSFIGK